MLIGFINIQCTSCWWSEANVV